MIDSLLVANRGEIACRVIRTARRLGIHTVAVYSDVDAQSMHVSMADSAVYIGKPPAVESYVNGAKIIAAAKASKVQAIHPGYGFLSENAEFVEAVKAQGLIFVGPSAAAIRAMGLKDAAKSLMEKAGVPVVPGYHGADQGSERLVEEARKIGYPVMIKARAGGGGKGMRLVEKEADFVQALESARREGQTAFGDAAVLVEKYISSPRHIEVQVFGDNHGNVIHLFERDCSLQRRHQKVIEEAPAPGMTIDVREAMTQAAVKAAQAIDYSGAGTIEFIADGTEGLRTDGFWFMEMNTRLQVEHPVTEALTGIDLVELQLRVASGDALPLEQSEIKIQGHAVEARVYAEDVAAGFLPATGTLQHVNFSERVRYDTGVTCGDEITPYYDPMIAKLIASAGTRERAISRLHGALKETHIAGTITNIEFLAALTTLPEFIDAKVDTSLIDRHLDTLISESTPSGLSKLIGFLSLTDIDFNTPMRGWRIWGEASHLLSVQFGAHTQRLRLVLHGDGSFSLQDEAATQLLARCSVECESDTTWRISMDDEIHRADVFSWNDRDVRCVSVLLDGQSAIYRCNDPLQVNTDTDEITDRIVAPMSGIIRQIDVSSGQSVNSGDRLLVLEAMKMETSVISPRDAVIKDIHCQLDDAVDGGSVLISLDETK